MYLVGIWWWTVDILSRQVVWPTFLANVFRQRCRCGKIRFESTDKLNAENYSDFQTRGLHELFG